MKDVAIDVAVVVAIGLLLAFLLLGAHRVLYTKLTPPTHHAGTPVVLIAIDKPGVIDQDAYPHHDRIHIAYFNANGERVTDLFFPKEFEIKDTFE